MSKTEHLSPPAGSRDVASPEEIYRASLADGGMLEDEAQARVMALLDQRFVQLAARAANKPSWLASLAYKFPLSRRSWLARQSRGCTCGAVWVVEKP